MVINDLKTTCTQCGGSGRLAGIRNMGIPQINLAGVCSHCEGRGYLLTELGRDLVALLRPFVEQVIAEKVPPAPRKQKPQEEEQE